MTKIKETKVTRKQFEEEEKNTKTQKTHGRTSQEDFKQKNRKNTTYGNVFLCFFPFNKHTNKKKTQKHRKHGSIRCRKEEKTQKHIILQCVFVFFFFSST